MVFLSVQIATGADRAGGVIGKTTQPGGAIAVTSAPRRTSESGARTTAPPSGAGRDTRL